MTAIIHKISVGAGGKHTLLPEKSLRRSVSLGNYAQNRSRANTQAIMAIKNAYNNASFSSVTAATESLGLSDNGFKTA